MEYTPLINFPFVQPGDDLSGLIIASMVETGINLDDEDILVIAQKIVSKSEGRLVNLAQVTPSIEALELGERIDKDPRLVELILGESNHILRVKPGTLIVEHKLGFICANAGIDHSNVGGNRTGNDEWYLLLPENPDKSAKVIREKIQKTFDLNIGISIIDSHGRAWRNGTVGTTIGLSGIPGVVDLKGKPDLFGYRLQATQVGTADELAAGASLVMGQADEKTPVVHVRGFPYNFMESSLTEILRVKQEDLFR